MVINQKVGKNVRDFLESRGISKDWVVERTGIEKTAFYNMLNGEGNIEEHVKKINELFGIKDKFYFYNENRNFEKEINHLDRKGNFFRGVENSIEVDEELKEGLEVFLETVELINILKAQAR